jgi:hypothetical protein
LLEKLAKIKAQAAGEAAIGNEEAAQAFAAKLQAMLLHHKLHMSDVDTINLEQEDPVGVHRVNFRAHDIPLKKRRVQWSEELASAVAWAHFCRILCHPGSNRISFVGRKEDALVAEYTFVTLYRAVERLADDAYAKFSTACVKECKYCGLPKEDHETRWRSCGGFEPNWDKARGYRPSYVDAFITRLANRLWHERKKVEQETTAASGSTALVCLRNAETAVKKYMEEHYGKKRADEFGGNQNVNYDGYRDGRRDADRVNLGGKALKTEEVGRKYLP